MADIKIAFTSEYKVPRMPNFLLHASGDENKKLSIADLDITQATGVAEAMRKAFMDHWSKKTGEPLPVMRGSSDG